MNGPLGASLTSHRIADYRRILEDIMFNHSIDMKWFSYIIIGLRPEA